MQDSRKDQLQVVLEKAPKSPRRAEHKLGKSPQPSNRDLDGQGPEILAASKEPDNLMNGKKLFQGTYAYIESRKRCTSGRPQDRPRFGNAKKLDIAVNSRP